MLSRRRILIIDPCADSREVLCTLFERRGAKTWETARIRQGCQLAKRAQPDVILLDGDHAGEVRENDAQELDALAARSSAPIVVLGNVRGCLSPLQARHFVSKPYQYATLIRRIEELLGNRA